ncbi:MAG TPA: HEAT repeat domain-containing protein [Rhodothermales bacterium]|nr:HEAT repeat domain-containing protein [Rhodothermales bacterium]
MDTLEEQILNDHYTAILEARKAGASVLPVLLALVHNERPEVRELSLYCLREIGGDDAAAAFVEALLDPEPQVRGVALGSLHQHPRSSVQEALFRAFDRSNDPYVRQQIPLIFGRMEGDDVRRADVVDRCRREHEPKAREGCMVVMAKWGDEDARHAFVAQLHVSRGRDRVRFLDYAQYIGGSWLLKHLSPLLEDTSPAVRVGVDGIPDTPQSRRVVDLAIDLIARIADHRFSFGDTVPTNYTDEQIEEVTRFLKSIP